MSFKSTWQLKENSKNMKKIIIIGNEIGAKTLYGYLNNDDRYQVVAFSVDKEYITEKQLYGLPVIPIGDLISNYSTTIFSIVLGLGYKNLNRNREQMFVKIKEMGYAIETYIHPTAVILNDNNIGEGSMIFAGSVVEPFTKIGKNTLVWANCVIAHNAEVGDNCWIASQTIISGEARVCKNVFLGINCTICNNVTIADNNIIGASTLISKCTQPNEVYLSRMGEKHRFDAENYAKFYLN
jgi:sugar O-acyltransferase (sialic acid O-acetyltransferase NeuD family)